MTKIDKIKYQSEIFQKFYSGDPENFSHKELEKVALEMYTFNFRTMRFNKLSSYYKAYPKKETKKDLLNMIQNELYVLKEIVKYNNGTDNGYITLDMVYNFLPYYQLSEEFEYI